MGVRRWRLGRRWRLQCGSKHSELLLCSSMSWVKLQSLLSHRISMLPHSASSHSSCLQSTRMLHCFRMVFQPHLPGFNAFVILFLKIEVPGLSMENFTRGRCILQSFLDCLVSSIIHLCTSLDTSCIVVREERLACIEYHSK